MKKGFWAAIAAAAATIIAAILYALGQRPVRKPASSTEELGSKIQEIQNKTDVEIIAEHTTPAQKEQIAAVVANQVNEAMQDAAKYRRKKQ